MMQNKKFIVRRIILILIILVVLAFAPYFLGDYYLSILRTVLIWVALSVSWHFFSGLTKYVSLGSAAFFGSGLYFTAKYLEGITKFGLPALSLPVIVLLAGLLNFGLALLIGLVALRLKGIFFAIVTFGISEIIRNVFQWWEIRITGTRGTYITLFLDSQSVYYVILLASFATILAATLLRRSKFGLALRMIGECEEAAAHLGVNTTMFKTLGFAITAMLIGFMGASYTARLTYTNTDIAFDALYSFLPAVMTLLGGAGEAYGPIVGAIALSLISEYLRVTFAHIFLIILGAVLVIIVIFMPNGIMGVAGKLSKSKLAARGKSG